MNELPKLDHPLFSIELPTSSKRVKYRAFNVREQKSLLVALGSGDASTMLDAINTCVNTCAFQKSDLPLVDAVFLFLAIRSKSVGEEIEPFVKCPKCEKPVALTGNLDKLTVKHHDGHNPVIELSSDLIVKLRYPTIPELLKYDLDKVQNDPETQFEMMVDCLETIWFKDQTFNLADYERLKVVEFFDDLPPDTLEDINKFFVTAPSIELEVSGVCTPCKETITKTLQEVSDFFR